MKTLSWCKKFTSDDTASYINDSLFNIFCPLDHDECGTNVHDCDTMAPATCHNTHGSFFCTCPEDGFGFRLNEDGRTCDGKWWKEIQHYNCTLKNLTLNALKYIIIVNNYIKINNNIKYVF